MYARAKSDTARRRVRSGLDRASEEYARLNAKTDEELEAMGLTRETIVQHVFADRMWL